MTTYRAIVSITFDDDDIDEMAQNIGCDADRLRRDPCSIIDGEMDNLSFGSGWVEQLFIDGRPTIARLSGGIDVQINEHESP